MTECQPACPWCRTAKHVQPSGTTLRAYYCGKCLREFEDGDDGTVGYGSPEKYAVRNENHAAAQRARLLRERTGGKTLRGGLGR